MSTARLEATGLSRRLDDSGGVMLVREASLTLEAGEFVAILGPSGCGKSSLMYLLGLLDRPTTGSVSIDGVEASSLNEQQLTQMRLEKLGFVFQFHFLLPELTARQNVELPMRRIGRMSSDAISARADTLFSMLGLEGQGEKLPEKMSGGQRQRVAIARAMANDPAVILGDEPTGNLDSVNTRVVIEEFQRIAHKEGRAVAAVTHDAEVAAAADRRIRMLDGRIVADERN